MCLTSKKQQIKQPGQFRKKGWKDMIYTVFPKQNSELPQDFPTFEAAKEYAEEEYGTGKYEIESTDGECL